MAKKILIVDDDAQIRKLLELTLRKHGYKALHAGDGLSAIKAVEDYHPDLLLVDVMMPGIDGFETVRRIRKTIAGAEVPIIMLSALSHVEDKVKGLRAGADDYVEKPVNRTELLARIEAHLRKGFVSKAKRILVLGGRFGIGTTSIAVNLAIALRKQFNGNVGLLDWRLPIGDVGTFLNLPEIHTLDALIPYLDNIDDELVRSLITDHASSGVHVLLGTTQPANAGALDAGVLERVADIWGADLDYLVIDGGSFFQWGTVPVPGQEAGVTLLVTTPELTTIRRTYKALLWFAGQQEIQAPFLVLNRSGMPGGMVTRQLKSQLNHDFLVELPEDIGRATLYMNRGEPIIDADAHSGLAKALANLASLVVKKLD